MSNPLVMFGLPFHSISIDEKIKAIELQLFKNTGVRLDYLDFRKGLDLELRKKNNTFSYVLEGGSSVVAGFAAFLTLLVGISVTIISNHYNLYYFSWLGVTFMIVGLLLCASCFAVSFGFDFGFEYLIDRVRLHVGLVCVGGIGGARVGVFAGSSRLRKKALMHVAMLLRSEAEIETFCKLCEGWLGSIDDAISASKVLS
ncbi:MAG: hypothetical protein ACKOW9_06325 [Candidatus Paceibacterota bacterium]